MTNTFTQVSVEGFKTHIKMSLAADVPLMAWSMPGLGKSTIIAETAAEQGFAPLAFIAGHCPPEDFSGIVWPNRDTMQAERLMPDIITSVHKLRERSGKPVCLFLDELPHADLSVQGPLYGITLDKAAAGYSMPDDTRVIAAGNPEGSGAITEELSSALRLRMSHVDFTGPTPAEFDAFCARSKTHPIIRAFVQDHPQYICEKFDPDERVSPNPRSLAMLGKLLDVAPTIGDKFVAAAGTIGHEAASDINAFIDIYGQMPSFKEICANGASAIVPSSFNAGYMVSVMMANNLHSAWGMPGTTGDVLITDAARTDARKALNQNIGAYMLRLPKELQAVSLMTLTSCGDVGDAAPVSIADAVTVFIMDNNKSALSAALSEVYDMSKLANTV